ncbi:MAG: hypothetical protein LKI59_09495 [Bacteroidales bacterium]|nr:hypothetical protein [Bacteroidales bacterium]
MTFNSCGRAQRHEDNNGNDLDALQKELMGNLYDPSVCVDSCISYISDYMDVLIRKYDNLNPADVDGRLDLQKRVSLLVDPISYCAKHIKKGSCEKTKFYDICAKSGIITRSWHYIPEADSSFMIKESYYTTCKDTDHESDSRVLIFMIFSSDSSFGFKRALISVPDNFKTHAVVFLVNVKGTVEDIDHCQHVYPVAYMKDGHSTKDETTTSVYGEDLLKGMLAHDVMYVIYYNDDDAVESCRITLSPFKDLYNKLHLKG